MLWFGLPYYCLEMRGTGSWKLTLEQGRGLPFCFVGNSVATVDCLFVRPACQVVVLLYYCCIHYMHGTIFMVQH